MTKFQLTYIDQFGFDRRSIGAYDAETVNTDPVVMVAVGPLIFLKLAQPLVKALHLFPPVNVFNLHQENNKKNKIRRMIKKKKNTKQLSVKLHNDTAEEEEEVDSEVVACACVRFFPLK